MSKELLLDMARQLVDMASALYACVEEEESEAVTVNKDGLPIKDGEDVGLTAGMSKDGVTSLHDKNIPETIKTKNGDWSVRESHDYHERVEDAGMQAGLDYHQAHRVATEAEHSRMRQMGFDPNEIEELLKPHIDAAAHEARARKNTTPEVGEQPYVDMDEDMGEKEPEDTRIILDRDGNRYVMPELHHVVGTVEVLLCSREDGSCHAVIDPNSGKVLIERGERDQALQHAHRMAERKGRYRLQKELFEEPAMSQQQLREKHGVPLDEALDDD